MGDCVDMAKEDKTENLLNRISNMHIFEKTATPPFPSKNFLLETTNFCNHKCIFCANSKMTRKRGFIDEKFAYRILGEAYALGMREVGFYATGEPLMNKNLEKYVKKAKEIGYSYTYLTTNGALMTRERANGLISAGIDSIKFSINAGTEKSYEKIHGHNDFQRVIENLKCMDSLRKKNNPHMKLFVSHIINKINIDEQNILYGLVKDYVDDILFVNVANQSGMMYEEVKHLTVEHNEHDFNITVPCFQVFNTVNISCEGYLTACCADFQNYLAVADLNEVSLENAWKSKEFCNLRNKHLNDSLQGTLCYNCVYNIDTPIKPIVTKYATMMEKGKDQ